MTAELKASLSSPAIMCPVPDTSTVSAWGTSCLNSSTVAWETTSDNRPLTRSVGALTRRAPSISRWLIASNCSVPVVDSSRRKSKLE